MMTSRSLSYQMPIDSYCLPLKYCFETPLSTRVAQHRKWFSSPKKLATSVWKRKKMGVNQDFWFSFRKSNRNCILLVGSKTRILMEYGFPLTFISFLVWRQNLLDSGGWPQKWNRDIKFKTFEMEFSLQVDTVVYAECFRPLRLD